MTKSAITFSSRESFQGARQILQYNKRFYFGALGAVVGGAIFLWIGGWSLWINVAVIAGVAMTLFWSTASLLVSHYVYDLSPLHSFDWLKGFLERQPRKWANIHAGLDETTAVLQNLLTGTMGQVLDIYDARIMTEPSIKHARKITPAKIKALPASYHSLPLQDASCDTVFVIFTAHELRQAEARQAFFGELHRVLENRGSVILVEHLRDIANFIAFGPGCWHFLPRGEWLKTAREADFEITSEIKITRFVRAFRLERK